MFSQSIEMVGLKRVDFIQLFYLLILCFLVYIHFSYMSFLKNDNFSFKPAKKESVGENIFLHRIPNFLVNLVKGGAFLPPRNRSQIKWKNTNTLQNHQTIY